jgi:5'-3' exonuclease
MSDKPTILAIDLSAIYFRSWVGSGPDTPITQAKQNTLDTIKRIEGYLPGSIAVICCDSKVNWRKKVSAEYKATREKQPDGFYVELRKTKERLVSDGYSVIEAEGYEADDVIASVVKACKDYEVVVCSPDKDLLQLVGLGVKQLRTHEMFESDADGNKSLKLWDETDVNEKFGVMPNRLADWLAITGDQADNVSGIPGVGGKGAATLIAEFGTLNTMFTTIEAAEKAGINPFDNKPALSRWAAKLTSFFLAPEQTTKAINGIARSRILVSLKYDVPIDVNKLFEKKEVKSIAGDKMEQKDTMETVAMPPEVAAEVDTESTQTKAISKIDPMEQFNAQLEPTGMAAAWWLVKRAVDSRLYDKFGTPERALMAVQRGRDFGLSVSASLELLQVIEGRVCPPSQVLQAMCQRHPDCLYFYVKDVSPTSATAVTCRKRKDGKEAPEQTFTYTVEMAKAAGLIKPNGAWAKNPAAMCVARAASWLARWAYPDATSGTYSAEEMEGERQ